MRLFLKFLIILFAALFIFQANIVSALSGSDSTTATVQVTAQCNNNGTCESDSGETETSCSNDCGCNNNGICESGRAETAQNCNDCVVVAGGSGGGYTLSIYEIKVKPEVNSADISWQTSGPALCKLFWGQTSQYEKKIIAETISNNIHSIKLEDLEMQQVYHYQISCSGAYNSKASTLDYIFSLPGIVNNISNFNAVAGDREVFLTWSNSENSGFQAVALVRNGNFYPQNKDDGTMIYQGYGNSFEDKNLVNGKTYYYTIFAIDKNKNYLLSAIASATPESKIVPVPQAGVTIKDFKFSAGGVDLTVKDNKTVEVPQNMPLTVSVDCDKILGLQAELNLQSQDKKEVFGFILKKVESNSCEVSINPSPVAGNYPLEILIVNSKNKIIQRIQIQLNVLSKNKFWAVGLESLIIYIIITSISIFFTIFFFNKRKKKPIRVKIR